MCQQAATPLTHFAPLIQLWAGICAICFYDTLIGSLVASNKRKKLRNNLNAIKVLLHEILDEKKHNLMIRKIDVGLFFFRSKVSHLGKLFCGLSIALLAIAGFESELGFDYKWLVIVIGLLFLYCVYIIEDKAQNFSTSTWSFIIPLIISCVILILGYHIDLRITDELNPHAICFIALLMMLLPVIYLILIYYIEERMARFRWELMKKLKKEFDAFVRIQSMGGTNFHSVVFSEKLQNLLTNAPNRAEKQNVFENYVIERLDGMFAYGSVWRYKFFMAWNSFKESEIMCSIRRWWIKNSASIIVFVIPVVIFGFLYFLLRLKHL